ncbi:MULTISPECIES: DUF2971 domain-containing protein [unclassified Neisseria]|jgi:hypothetical protein|uniref:DUF2971 domain-containing protein n=1 Tax=unclassified Neisseria TaxID=2623750 RepID=UPI00022BF3C2|nr:MULTISPECIES: DUF2971 domain-containing protein [unclassified Neisseria]EGY62618.1 hypothetical protein HMPREF1028_00525 [Neisseria sp. GT4A_CT1]MDU1533502.1 DUF2971 domain-containing protein [Neisseria sp.]OFL99382.1 hypothetical protein HMPREF2726_06270 [Neisseria sp. HMSC074B07]
MKINEYSKFRDLNYGKDDDNFENFWKKNKHTKSIFENSELFAQNYKKFNDVDECVYLVDKSISKTLTDKIYNEKQENVICCFSSSKIIGTYGEELMWAHYANSSKGIRIDFTIDKEFEDIYVKKVEYKPKKQFNNGAQLKEELNNNKLENIMCRKSKAWAYEKEHRAIFHKDGIPLEEGKKLEPFIFPINIKAITFGRGCGFFPDKKPDVEAYDFKQEQKNAEKHILKIASFIYKVLKESNKYKDSMPEFYRYEDKYSLKTIKIEENELSKEMKKIQNKSQDKIQKLSQKIVQLQKEIVDLEKEIVNLKKAKQ